MKYSILFSVAMVLMLVGRYPVLAQFPAACDKDKSCVGLAITQKISSGSLLQFVKVKNTPSQNMMTTAMTVEMWVKTEKQSPSRQYLAGYWGPHSSPGDDRNDIWVLYIDGNDNLVFELNSGAANLGPTDNTLVQAALPGGFYDAWHHIAGVFAGGTQTATLYIDGVNAGSARNAQYPLPQLYVPKQKDLYLQIANASAVSDRSEYRTFLGQMDEVRLWSRALSDVELICNKDRSLNGNEPGMVLYYRCNDPNTYELCDATGNDNIGTMVNGGTCQKSDRIVSQTITVLPPSVTTDLICDSTATYTFTVEDTSFCGNKVVYAMTGRDRSEFSVLPGTDTLLSKQAKQMNVRIKTRIVGSIQADLEIRPADRCGAKLTVPIRLQRRTELDYSLTRANFDTLYANCKEMPYSDTTITITNHSDQTGTPEDVTITSLSTNMPQVFTLIPSGPIPVTLKVGESLKIKIRFTSHDSSATYFDTLLINSTDRCAGNGIIPLRGIVKEVLSIRTTDGAQRIDSIYFGKVCPGQLSGPVMYVWKDLTARPITIDKIIIPPDFIGRSIQLPVTLQPNMGYSANYFRFRPLAPGWVRDSIIFVTHIEGCTIEKKIYVSGYGYSSDVVFDVPNIDFGNVIVGQKKTLSVKATNQGTDSIRISFYLDVGDEFYLTGGNGTTLAPGETKSLQITFIPLKDSLYIDKLCLFEQRCFTVHCIEVRGRGIIQTFVFKPERLRIDNVIGCDSSGTGTIEIVNVTGMEQELRNMVLNDPSGKFSAVSPPAPYPPSLKLAPGASVKFTIRYTPNDVTMDRADRATLHYTTPDGVEWEAQILGTSVTPKLFVTELTAYGTIEVNDTKKQTLLVENISAVPVRVDNFILPPGYTATNYSKPLGSMLQPRDSMLVEVQFAPTLPQDYSGIVKVESAVPCPISTTGKLEGKGVIVQLEALATLISFSYVRPCDCKILKLHLTNKSLVFPMTVDSIWIDGQNLPGATPQFFSWTAFSSPGATLPYTIPASFVDTVYVKFCPRSTALPANIDNGAVLHVRAHGQQWNGEYETFLSGKRMLTFTPVPASAPFPPTNVDATAAPRFIDIVIPPVTDNPNQEPIIIDSISFLPNERVFTAVAANGAPFPLTVKPGDTLRLKITFKPRVPRDYEERMVLHISAPCVDQDTTVLVQGKGLALPFGLNFAFENNRIPLDTFRINTCDTLNIPVFTSRKIPADLVDIHFNLEYDTTQIRFVDVASDYLKDTCSAVYFPAITSTMSTTGGVSILAKNFCNVDTTKPFVITRFVSATGQRADIPILLDSISFDSEETILYQIFAGTDDGRVIVDQPGLKIQNSIAFDSVRVLECVDREMTVLNTGDVPITIHALQFPENVQFVQAIPDTAQFINPGDSIRLVLRFCPQRFFTLDSTTTAESLIPCSLHDTTQVTGIGYAPDFPVRIGLSSDFTLPAGFSAVLGDTVTLPLYLDTSFSVTYNGTTYWIRKLNFDVQVDYNIRMLKFFAANSPVDSLLDVRPDAFGTLLLHFKKLDSLKAGKIADLRFVVTVPDSLQSALFVNGANFSTDSLMFLKIIPVQTQGAFATNSKCNVTFLQYPSLKRPSTGNLPNPIRDRTRIDFTIQETVPVILQVYSMTGTVVKTLLDGSTIFARGTHSVEFDARDVPAGVYYYRVQAGIYSAVRAIVVVK